MNRVPLTKELQPESSVYWAGRAYLVFFFFACAYLFPFVRVLWRVGDEGSIVYGAQLITEGRLPYRDFFEVMGPASFYWLGLFFKFFGTKFAVARALLLFTGAVTAVLIYWLTRRLYRGPLEMIPALYCLITNIPFWPASSHHWDSNLFALFGVGSFVIWEDTRRIRYLAASGVLVGLTSCFMLQKGLLLLAAFILILLLGLHWKRDPLKTILICLTVEIACFGTVIALVIVYYYRLGELYDLVYANLIWPLTSYHSVNVVPYAYGLGNEFWLSWLSLVELSLPLSVATILCIVISIPLAIIAALPFLSGLFMAFLLRKISIIRDGRSVPYWVTGSALWASEMQRLDMHHLIFGSPLLLIPLFSLLNTFSKDNGLLSRLGAILITVPLLLLGTYKFVVASSAPYKMDTRRGTVRTFTRDTALQFLNEVVPAGEQVFIYPYLPMYYFLADVENPTRYSILMYNINTDAQFQETIAALERNKVRYVLWDTFVEGPNFKIWFPNYVHPPKERLHLEQYLEAHYQVIDIRNGFRILRRKEQPSNSMS